MRMCGLCSRLLCPSSPHLPFLPPPSAGRWGLYCQETITLTDVIYLPIISIIHITLISSLFLCPSPSVPLPFPPNFLLLFILLNFLPSSILALCFSYFSCHWLEDEKQSGENCELIWMLFQSHSLMRIHNTHKHTHPHTYRRKSIYKQTVIVIK